MIRLYLGCNQRPKEGYVNVDIVAYPGVDVVADLEKRWPWEDGSVDEILTVDLPEHLRQWWEEPDPDLMQTASRDFLHEHDGRLGSGKYLSDDEISLADLRGALRCIVTAIRNPKRTYGIIHFMNEAHRVLKVGGKMQAVIPSTDARGWSQDPTHVSYWNENTPLYFTSASPYKLREQYPGLITADFKPISVRTGTPNALGISWVTMVLEK